MFDKLVIELCREIPNQSYGDTDHRKCLERGEGAKEAHWAVHDRWMDEVGNREYKIKTPLKELTLMSS